MKFLFFKKKTPRNLSLAFICLFLVRPNLYSAATPAPIPTEPPSSEARRSLEESAMNYFSYLAEIIHYIKNYHVDQALLQDNFKTLTYVLKKIQDELPDLKIKEREGEFEFRLHGNRFRVNKDLSDINFIQALSFLAFEYKRDQTEEISLKKSYQHITEILLSYLDPHSTFLDEEGYRELIDGTRGSFGGIGIVVNMSEEHTLTILDVLPGTPAEESGLKKNDHVIAIEGESAFGSSLNDLVSLMKGRPGSSVTLTLLSEGAEKPHTKVIERKVISVDSVESDLIEKEDMNFLHLKVKTFSSRTAEEIRTHITEAQRLPKTLGGLILDLRRNPGGLLEQALAVSDLFLEQGIIVQTRGLSNEISVAREGDEICTTCRIVTLINPQSASASEIVSAALSDNKRAILIGETSYGKSTVQRIFPLQASGQSFPFTPVEAIKLTTDRYYPPSGNSISQTGVKPDLIVQRVHLEEENSDLFGPYRYGREAFEAQIKTLERGGEIERDTTETLQLYHLISNEEEAEEDFLLKVAEEILVAYTGIESPFVSIKDLQRQSEEVRNFILKENKNTQKALKEKYDVLWSFESESHRLESTPQLSLQEHKKISSFSFVPGNKLTLKYKIKNPNKIPIERSSVFIRDEYYGVSIDEQLVGEILPGKSASGEVTITLPVNPYPRKKYTFQLGLALDGVPQVETLTSLAVQIEDIRESQLETHLVLSDESLPGSPGSLEPLEKGTLSFIIQNKSSFPTKDVTLQLYNLAGKQIEIDEEAREITSLKAQEKRTVKFKVKASKKLMHGALPVGASVTSFSLKEAHKQTFHIKSSPVLVREN